jgi:hypothetical protein
MKKFLIAIGAAATLVVASPSVPVLGQAPPEPTIGPAPRTVNLTAEQRFIIKEIVLKDLNVADARDGAPEVIGEPVPQNVELHPMTKLLAAKVPQAKSHKFYVKDGTIVLVSPSDRRVADVIK